MKVSGVYRITNKVNGKVYIGQSTNLISRKGQHFRSLRKGMHPNIHLQNEFKKYGEASFVWEIVKEGPPSVLNVVEPLLIAKHKALDPDLGYNKKSGGNRNQIMSKEAREKMSASRRKIMTPEFRAKISAAHSTPEYIAAASARARAQMTPEFRAKIAETNRGHVVSAETRIKIGQASRGRKVSEITRQRCSASSRAHWNNPEFRRKQLATRADPAWRKRRAFLTKRTMTPEFRAKLSRAHLGHKPTMDTRNKMRAAQRRRRLQEKISHDPI